MGGASLRAGIHLHWHLLLLLLIALGKLKSIGLLRHSLHLSLHLITGVLSSSWQLLLRRDHAHVHILLMSSSNLLLLLLKGLDLVLQSQLFHCTVLAIAMPHQISSGAYTLGASFLMDCACVRCVVYDLLGQHGQEAVGLGFVDPSKSTS